MNKIICPAGKQDTIKERPLYNHVTSNVYNSFSLICEAEQAYYDTGKVEIIIGRITNYRLKYKGELFEFDHDELLTADAFNKKCLASGFNIVNFGNRGWLAYISEIQKKAIIYNDVDYPENVKQAIQICFSLYEMSAVKLSFDFESILEKDGYYFVPINLIDELVKEIPIEKEILKGILEKRGIKQKETTLSTDRMEQIQAWDLLSAKLECEELGKWEEEYKWNGD